MKLACAALMIGCGTLWAVDPGAKQDADRALAALMEGNARFAAGHPKHPDQTVRRRHELTTGQKPFAVILSCADSRVPPEHIFDQGLGDLFVVRVAGNVVDDHVLGSIEYAVEHLGAQLIVVLGHQKCGAIQAALAADNPHGHVKSLVDSIRPALDKENHDVDLAVRSNVRLVVKEILDDEPLHEAKAKVVGARYDLDTGKVELLK